VLFDLELSYRAMGIKNIFYKTRFSLLMCGFAWLIRVVGIINRDFHVRLSQNDYSFIMGSKEDDTARHFQFIGGNLRSGRSRIPVDFVLIWQDNKSGGKVMTDIVLGKRKALYNAAIKGVLTLEGNGKYVSLFMETMNHLNLIFTKKKANVPAKPPE
jgi:hypothetical protein